MFRSFVPVGLFCLGLAISAACSPERIQAQTPPTAPQLSAEERAAKLAERDRLWKEADELRAAEKFDEALERLARCIKQQRAVFGDKTAIEAAVLEQIAMNERDQQHWVEARTAAVDALSIREKVNGPDDWRTVDARLMVADVERWSKLTGDKRAQLTKADKLLDDVSRLRDQGKYREAVALVGQELALRRQVLGDDHRLTGDAWNRFGFIYDKLGDAKNAETALLKALEIRKKALGEAHPDYANSLNNLAMWYQHMGKYAQSEPLLTQALELRKKILGEDHPDYASSLSNLALHYDTISDYARAGPLYKQALEIRKQVLGEAHPDYANSMSSLASLYIEMGDYARAESLYKQTLEIRKKALGEAHPDYAHSLNSLAFLYYKMGDYVRAEPLYKQALEINKRILGEDHPYCAESLNNLAVLYDEMGDYARAEPLYKQALEIKRKALGENHPDYARSLSNLAVLYWNLGDYTRAEPLYEQALEIRKKALGEAHPDYAQSLNNLAVLYDDMGDYARAEPLYKQALEIKRKALGENHPDYARSLSNLAELYRAKGDYARAEPLYKQALEIRKKSLGEAHPNYAQSLNNLAGLYESMGVNERAEPLFEQALEVERKALGEAHPEYATVLDNLGLLQLTLGRPADAEKLLRQAVQIKRKSLDLTAAVQSEQQQLTMSGSVRGYLDGYLTGALTANIAAAEIYAEVAAWKGSVSAQQQLLRARQRALAGDPNSRFGQLFAQLEQQTRRLAALMRYIPKSGEAAQLQRSLRKLSESVNALQQQLSRLDPDFHRAWSERRISHEQLRQALPVDAALIDVLEYSQYVPPTVKGKQATWARRLVAFVLRRDQSVTCVQLGPSALINRLVDQWRSGYGKALSRDEKLPGVELRRLVWEPLESSLTGIKIVLISPDGALARLSWAALPGAQPDTYLLEERALAVVTVPQRLPEMLAAEAPRDSDHSLLLVGDVGFGAAPGVSEPGRSRAAVMRGTRIVWPALPGTKVEVEEIQKVFVGRFSSERPMVLEQAAATESAVRVGVARRYLHLATHGFFAPPEKRPVREPKSGSEALLAGQQPAAAVPPSMLAGIVLAGANRPLNVDEDDGILTAFEVSELNLEGAELVILSACETGLGESAGGEGLLGLQRAFQIAGAKTVISGLWKVPDAATQMLMVRFYENLWVRKMGKLAALREAQIWMLREVPKDAKLITKATRGLTMENDQPADAGALPPFYWAAFVLSGDWR